MFIPRTLSIGSSGPEVKDLQSSLNLLPTFLPRLGVDGSFGPKTKSRTVEFQQQSFLVPDGVVGPATWAKLLKLISQLIPGNVPPENVPPTDPNEAKRNEIVQVARSEAAQPGVAAKLPLGTDPADGRAFRMGHERLLKYFRTAAPIPGMPGTTFFSEDAITHLKAVGQLSPMPHWCGIFALWALKTANTGVGNWKLGSGISSVKGIKQLFPKTKAQKGDVGFVNNGFEHHFIIEEVVAENGLQTAHTIEGNSDPNSNFNFKSRSINSIHSVYSAF